MNNIKLFLIRNFGSIERAALHLDVTGATVRNWCGQRPRNMLKHLPEIHETTGVSYGEIIEEVMTCEREGLQ
jgi:hypothetical protein